MSKTAILIAVVVLLIALAGLAYLAEYRQDWESKNWPTTIGRIAEAEALAPVRDEGWDLKVSYEYQVESVSYTPTV